MERESSSVSRGCFLFNANKTASTLSGSMRKLPMEESKHVLEREQAFTECWEAVEEEIKGITSSQHDKVFGDVLQFILSSHKKLHTLHSIMLEAAETPFSSRRQLPPRLEVFAAVLITGVNMPDHAVLFERLERQIHAQCSPYVVLLRARDCNSGMKATMKRILLQLMKVNTEQESSDEEEDHKPRPPGHLPLCSMRVLCKWYSEAVGTTAGSGLGHRPPVIIIIEDFEAFAPQVLQDLILSLSPRLPEFPAMLILGVATSVGVVHRVLPQRVTSLLSIQQFHTQHSALTLAQIMDKVLLTHKHPFNLGPKVLRFLLHQFFYCNFSLADFSHGLKFAMMEHYYWNPLSLMCWQSISPKQLSGWGNAVCESVRATSSFQRYIEVLDPLQRLPLLESKAKLKLKLKELLHDMETYHQTFYPLLRCLYHLTHDLPEAPLGKKLHEVFLLSLEQDIVEQSKFESAWTLVNLMSKDTVSGRVSLCLQTLEQASATSCETSRQVFKEVMALFTTFTLEANKPDRPAASTVTVQLHQQQPSQSTTGERKLRFQEHLRNTSARRSEPSPLDIARGNLTKSLRAIFAQHLRAPHNLPLHEAFYFDHVSSLELQLAPHPRKAIQSALSNPAGYLAGANAGGYPHKTISANMPDICIVYQLHLEYGKFINLYDWLQAFILVVDPDAASGDNEEEASQKKDVDIVLHGRFVQAISELQLLGFIKPTQRKTDHVQRLTWGLC